MPALKLYQWKSSPNSRRIRVFIAEKGITIPYEPVNLGEGEQRTDWYVAINPRRGHLGRPAAAPIIGWLSVRGRFPGVGGTAFNFPGLWRGRRGGGQSLSRRMGSGRRKSRPGPKA